MPLTIIKKPSAAKAAVTTAHKEKGETIAETASDESVELPEGLKPGLAAVMPYCQVGFEGSFTENLGDFRSCRVNVSISIPCEHSEIDKIYVFAQEWVNARLSQCMAEIKGEE